MQNDTTVKSDPKGGERTDKRSQPGERSKADEGTNHGEGNPDAAARFNRRGGADDPVLAHRPVFQATIPRSA
jgi:hypothetical protein